MTVRRPGGIRSFYSGELLLLLVLLVAFPSVASADIGLSAELRYMRRSAAPAAERHDVVAALPSSLPVEVGASAPGAAAVAATDRGASRTAHARRGNPPAPRLLAARSAAHRSRCLAARDLTPTIALATRGVVGFHISPAPPLA